MYSSMNRPSTANPKIPSPGPPSTAAVESAPSLEARPATSESTTIPAASHATEKENKPQTSLPKTNQQQHKNPNLGKMSDPNFIKYLKILTIDPVKEPHLVWIAEEGYIQPLGTEWRVVPTDDGEFYFVNRTSGQYTWEHPFDEYYRKMVEDWRSNKTDKTRPPPPVPKRFISKPPPLNGIKQKSQDDFEVEILSDDDLDEVYSTDSATLDSPDKQDTDLDVSEDDDEIFNNDKEFFITSPRPKNELEKQSTFNSDDSRKKVTFSKHLVKIYEFNNEQLQWKRSNLFKKQNSNDSNTGSPQPVKEIEDKGLSLDKATAGQRPGTPLIVTTERFRRLKNVQKRADSVIYRNWREFCTAVTESYANVHYLAAAVPVKVSTGKTS